MSYHPFLFVSTCSTRANTCPTIHSYLSLPVRLVLTHVYSISQGNPTIYYFKAQVLHVFLIRNQPTIIIRLLNVIPNVHAYSLAYCNSKCTRSFACLACSLPTTCCFGWPPSANSPAFLQLHYDCRAELCPCRPLFPAHEDRLKLLAQSFTLPSSTLAT
jgi:hypothetical protein